MPDYPQLFEGLSTMKDEYTIKLKDDAKPLASGSREHPNKTHSKKLSLS